MQRDIPTLYSSSMRGDHEIPIESRTSLATPGLPQLQKKMDGKWVDQVAKQPIFPETNATNGYHAAYEAPNIINVESPN